MDTVKKQILIITILFVGLINIAQGQVFKIQSIDGDSQQICVVPHYGSKTLIIATFKDTLYIKDFTGIKAMLILNKYFLKIDYSIRAGSDLHVIRTLILSVNNNAICQSLFITSFVDELYMDFRKPADSSDLIVGEKLSKTGIELVGNTSQNYKLNIKIHEEKKSKYASKNNYNRDTSFTLNFDPNQNIFYSAHQDISKYFTVYNPETQKETKQYVMGTFPVVKLGRMEYYYIKNEWYEKSNNDELSKYSYR